MPRNPTGGCTRPPRTERDKAEPRRHDPARALVEEGHAQSRRVAGAPSPKRPANAIPARSVQPTLGRPAGKRPGPGFGEPGKNREGRQTSAIAEAGDRFPTAPSRSPIFDVPARDAADYVPPRG